MHLRPNKGVTWPSKSPARCWCRRKKNVTTYRTPAEANKHLLSKHFKQLLLAAGHKTKMYEVAGPRKGRLLLLADLRDLFWRNHVPATPSTVPASPAHTTDGHESSDHTTDGDESSTEDERGMSEAVPFSVNNRVRVWWPAAKNWYEGVVTDVSQSDNTYEVHYKHDDEYEWHDLSWKTELLD